MNTTQTLLPGISPPPAPVLRGEVRHFDDCSSAEVAHIYGISVQAIDGWKRRGCPYSKEGGQIRYHLPSVVQWRRAEDAKQRGAHVGYGDDDILGAPGEDSPELRRMRQIKGDMWHDELLLKRGHLLETDKTYAAFRTAGQQLAKLLESLEPLTGAEYRDALREGLAAIERTIGQPINPAESALSLETESEIGGAES